jgi:hypothetical protein
VREDQVAVDRAVAGEGDSVDPRGNLNQRFVFVDGF